MNLRIIDLRTLDFDPSNPRRTRATTEQDAQLTANIKRVGVLQPPVVRPHEKGSLVVVAGERRVSCAIAAGLVEDYVLVRGPDDGGDAVRALSENASTRRDHHLRIIAEKGRMGWQKATGYNARARAEAAVSRCKRVIEGLCSRTEQHRAVEVNVGVHALNCMLGLGRPNYIHLA